MGLMDLFSKNESKEKPEQKEEKNEDNVLVSEFVELESQDETKKDNNNSKSKDENDETLVSHHESLESQKTSEKTDHKNRESYSDQNIWRDVDAIEEKVDNLHIDRAVRKRSDLDKKVDVLLKKNK